MHLAGLNLGPNTYFFYSPDVSFVEFVVDSISSIYSVNVFCVFLNIVFYFVYVNFAEMSIALAIYLHYSRYANLRSFGS